MFWLIRLLNVGGSLISPSVSAARDREIRCLMSVYFYTTSQKKKREKKSSCQCSAFQVKERFILTASSVRRLSRSYVACFSSEVLHLLSGRWRPSKPVKVTSNLGFQHFLIIIFFSFLSTIRVEK